MAINPNNKLGINLTKGSFIDLQKEDGEQLTNITIGLNWGAIHTKALFGLIRGRESVDLDGSVAIFDKDHNLIDQVYYGKLVSLDGAIRHSGDDLVGDRSGDDGIDNEVISVNLLKVSPLADQIVFFLNSFKGQDFADIPYSRVRIYNGTTSEVKSIIATFNLSSEPAFAEKVSMIMGKLVKVSHNNWRFQTIGEAVDAQRIPATIKIIQNSYL